MFLTKDQFIKATLCLVALSIFRFVYVLDLGGQPLKTEQSELHSHVNGDCDRRVVKWIANASFTRPGCGTQTIWSWEQVRQHNCKNERGEHKYDLWLVIHGEVYDVSQFIASHPGSTAICEGAEIDATAIYTSIHPKCVDYLLWTFCIGQITVTKEGTV